MCNCFVGLVILIMILRQPANKKIINQKNSATASPATLFVLSFTKIIQKNNLSHGITCNSVCPGLVTTPMTVDEFDRRTSNTEEAKKWQRRSFDDYAPLFPIPRISTPEEVGHMVRYLCSAEAGYVTGASFDINGGDLMV
jgi:NAD(P)-dependent dehydrogenase (short-subunit alcohol dehydrogenase family)